MIYTSFNTYYYNYLNDPLRTGYNNPNQYTIKSLI